MIFCIAILTWYHTIDRKLRQPRIFFCIFFFFCGIVVKFGFSPGHFHLRQKPEILVPQSSWKQSAFGKPRLNFILYFATNPKCHRFGSLALSPKGVSALDFSRGYEIRISGAKCCPYRLLVVVEVVRLLAPFPCRKTFRTTVSRSDNAIIYPTKVLVSR